MITQLTQLLSDRYGVPEEALAAARAERNESDTGIGDLLVQKNIISETQLLEARSELYDLPVWNSLPVENVETGFTQKVPIQFLKRYHMFPLRKADSDAEAEEGPGQRLPSGLGSGPDAGLDSDCIIAVNNPALYQALDDLTRILGFGSYDLVLAAKNEILSAINFSYDLSRDSAEQLVHDMEEDSSVIIGEIEGTADLLDDTSDAPIIKLVNHIISQSVKARASDIHIEPYQDSFRVRYRVDGILYDLLTPPKWIQASLISRIKVMANMNIAEKRKPQDGRIPVKIGQQEIDVRTSTIPTAFGERVVLRLLNKSDSRLSLPELGLSAERLSLVKDLAVSSNGIILVTGPTGSGKTTTLYAILSSIITPDINIITVEDPIEYQIKGISQIQVDRKIDLTFAQGLRSIVRQDPDVILVGEIRDAETADIAIESALTGHLVFSTVHTNDSASTITRLVDIGVEPFLISSAVIAVIAQRLVRVLCENCKTPFTPDEAALNTIGILPGQLIDNTLYRANGCDKCTHGYMDRMGLFEIMVMSESLKSLALQTYDASQIKKEALNEGLITLRQDGIEKVIQGTTTIEEVLRKTQS